MIIIDDIQQNSQEWMEARAGHPTSSCFDKIITPKTMKPSSQAKNYLYTLAGERIAGIKAESYSNQWMERGMELQNEAMELFQVIRDVEIKEVGLIYPDEKKGYSCSPDGLLMDSKEGLEVKCPSMHFHVKYLLDRCLPPDYIPQVQGSILISGFSSWWFMSYYPGLPPLIVRVFRDDKFCATLKVLLDEFCEELDEVESKLRKLAE